MEQTKEVEEDEAADESRDEHPRVQNDDEEYQFDDTEDNKLLRKFLTTWDETYHNSKPVSKEEKSFRATFEKQETNGEDQSKLIFGRKIYDFKTKKFIRSENK